MPNLMIKHLLTYCLPLGAALSFNKRDNSIEITLQRNTDIVQLLRTLKDKFQFKQLTDITRIHYPTPTNHFQVRYLLLSIETNVRLKVNTYTTSKIHRVVDLYPGASWMEREIWDMFGILFQNGDNTYSIQNRILTDYGFKGHPLLKDFPESGLNEVMYDEDAKRVITVTNTIRITRKRK